MGRPYISFYIFCYNSSYAFLCVHVLFVGHVGGCGINDEVVQWMDRIQNSAVEEDSPPPPSPPKAVKLQQAHAPPVMEPHASHNKYSREANEPSTDHHRKKRATRPKEENKNTCSLFIQTDPLIWRHISDTVSSQFVKKFLEEVEGCLQIWISSLFLAKPIFSLFA